ncbi:MAG: transposase [Halanaerobiales bacterium]|nr:transposase [Halanaerobiales bacterium]
MKDVPYLTTTNRLHTGRTQYSILQEMCHTSKNLYNYTLYTVRQYFFENKKFLNYEKAYHIVKNNENYKLLPSQVAQQVMRSVNEDFEAFFGLVKKKRTEIYKPKTNLPHYLPKNGVREITFTPAHFTILHKHVRLTLPKHIKKKYNLKFLYFPIPPHIRDYPVKEVQIQPYHSWFKIAFKYIDTKKYKLVKKDTAIMAIDLGIDNLCTIVSEKFSQPTIIDGRGIKSYNRLFNKKLAKKKSTAMNCSGQHMTKSIARLYEKRNNYMRDKIHKISCTIVSEAVKNNINTICIGYNEGWKTKCNMSKVVNQKFVSIPYKKLIKYITYKAKKYGIEVMTQEESYTSKCDALAFEEIRKHEAYKGKRVSRGIFLSSTGKLINADVNGALNILRKCKGDFSVQGIVNRGCVFQPKRSLEDQTSFEAPTS